MRTIWRILAWVVVAWAVLAIAFFFFFRGTASSSAALIARKPLGSSGRLLRTQVSHTGRSNPDIPTSRSRHPQALRHPPSVGDLQQQSLRVD